MRHRLTLIIFRGATTIAAALAKSSPKKSPAHSRFHLWVCIIRALGGDRRQQLSTDVALWLGGRVVMQRIANPSTPVRFRPEPPILGAIRYKYQMLIGSAGSCCVFGISEFCCRGVGLAAVVIVLVTGQIH